MNSLNVHYQKSMLLNKYGDVTCSLLVICCFVQGNGQNGHPATPAPEERSATFVTSLYDIGRGSWPSFKRTFSNYLKRFTQLLAVDINLIIFGEHELIDFVTQYRGIDEYEEDGKGLQTKARRKRSGTYTSSAAQVTPSDGQTSSRTRFVTLPFRQLSAYEHKLKIDLTLRSKKFRAGNDRVEHRHPEAMSTEYLVLMNSKMSLVGKVARENPFNTTHFFWIDAGYAADIHINRACVAKQYTTDVTECVNEAMTINIPAGVRWKPETSLPSKRVTYIEIHDVEDYVNLTYMFKKRVAPPFAGGFFGGARNVMMYFQRLTNKCFLSQLTEGTIGDDQLVALDAYFEQPGIFHLMKGHWFDAYSLFH